MAKFTEMFVTEEEQIEEARRLYASLPAPSGYEKSFFDLVATLSASDDAWGYTYSYQKGQKQPGGMEEGTPGEKARYTLLTLLKTCDPETRAADEDGEAEIKRDKKKLEELFIYTEDKEHLVDLRKALKHQLQRTECAFDKIESYGPTKKRNMVWFRQILSHVDYLLSTHEVKRPKFCAAGVMLYGGVDPETLGLSPTEDLVAIYKNHEPSRLKALESRLTQHVKTLSEEVEKHGVAEYFGVWDL